MADLALKSLDSDFDDALRLFMAMHDTPSSSTAQDLVDWLAQCPQHVQVFDEVLTFWALVGGGLIKRANAAVLDEPCEVQ